MDVFSDRILSTLCLLFVPEEEELYLLETLDFFLWICVVSLLIFCGIMLLFSSLTLKFASLLTVTSLYSLFSRFIWPTGYNVTFFVVLVLF